MLEIKYLQLESVLSFVQIYSRRPTLVAYLSKSLHQIFRADYIRPHEVWNVVNRSAALSTAWCKINSCVSNLRIAGIVDVYILHADARSSYRVSADTFENFIN